VSLPETLRRQPKWLVLVEALVLVGLIGWGDYITGWEWSFFAPFALPIILVTWKTGRRLGFGCASLCALAFWAAHIESNPYHTAFGFGLAVFGRWLYFSILAVAVAALKDKRELDRVRIATLERTQELEQENLEIADLERERLGRDLHDGLCQTLAGISALSTTLSKKLGSNSHVAASAEAAEITKLLKEAIGEARDLARGLGPVNLEKAGLGAALEVLAANVQDQFRVSCILKCDREIAKLGQEVEMHLFRIAQQAMHNALDHGKAERIEISLSARDGKGLLFVQDDGVGLPSEAPDSDGSGIRTMSHRAHLIGASLEIRRGMPRGVEVRCTFPLSQTSDT
jgi:signal transduction histidine kinase